MCAVPWRVSVPWRVLSTVGDIMSTVGGYLQYRGGYHDKCGGYLEYRGGFHIMMHAGDIMSTVGGVQYHGEYHPLKFEYHGDIMSNVGMFCTVDIPPMVLNTLTVLMISPRVS